MGVSEDSKIPRLRCGGPSLLLLSVLLNSSDVVRIRSDHRLDLAHRVPRLPQHPRHKPPTPRLALIDVQVIPILGTINGTFPIPNLASSDRERLSSGHTRSVR